MSSYVFVMVVGILAAALLVAPIWLLAYLINKTLRDIRIATIKTAINGEDSEKAADDRHVEEIAALNDIERAVIGYEIDGDNGASIEELYKDRQFDIADLNRERRQAPADEGALNTEDTDEEPYTGDFLNL